MNKPRQHHSFLLWMGYALGWVLTEASRGQEQKLGLPGLVGFVALSVLLLALWLQESYLRQQWGISDKKDDDR